MGNSFCMKPPTIEEDKVQDAGDAVISHEDDEKKKVQMVKRGRRVSVSAECGVSKTEYTRKHFPKTQEQLEKIKKAVANNFLFQGLDKAQFEEILGAMFERKVTAGEIVIKQGDPGDNFYVIDSGEYDVYVRNVNDGKPVFHYVPGQSFGELALMYNCPRAATIKACSDGVLWAVDRATFQHIIVTSSRQRRERYESFLQNIGLLKNLNSAERSQIADALYPVDFKPDEVVIRQGDSDRSHMRFYIIEKGEAIATVDRDGENVIVGHMKEGDYFGEKALIESAPRAANVIAKGPLTCAAMDVAAFERLMGDCREIMSRQIKDYKTVEEVKAELAHSG
eukprot:TRINITY_DN1504_c0_g1::TRINITY_DN1504_c0_g1_i1::g.28227::m.28227 TRINITY_DN1504_c0_g1::TRINITY_DN1504_c0_g1_i1::g.28227  ORF type:complete len:337 (-),score=102.05,sp/P31320/KAPR_BLAEM/45.89/9e-79,cNMP_binding/PF00027.24/5.2e+03,cNMP_binding/PF00027.24/4.5e-21,cNMP_binding/PF00027.24/9e-18,SH2_2/PF14633.1/0.94,SH2_2/PF14633.1/1.6e+02 TRINITY_DN1504_c0_g1_i1:851-1861(-)